MLSKDQLLVFDEISLLQVMSCDFELSHLGYILTYTLICGQQHYSVGDKVLGTKDEISVNMNISILGVYEYIENISKISMW